MRRAVFRIMLLSLLRDRGALAMSFLLPGLVYAIFAITLAAASGGQLGIKLAVADLRSDALSDKVIEGLTSSASLRMLGSRQQTRAAVLRQVQDGSADVGLVIHPPGAGASGGPDQRPFELVIDPSREIATTMLQANLQKAISSAQPGRAPQAADLFERTSALRSGQGFTAAAYYAGAVSIMFLLFSALTSASSYLDERENGLLERISSGTGGPEVVIDGKFLFLVVQGWLQIGIVFLIAWLLFGVDLPSTYGLWGVTSLMVAIAGAGLVMAFVTLLRTRRQADSLGQMIILVVSAIGGSMVPRFMMPDEMHAIGWLTPNAWALEAYASLFWRGEDAWALLEPWYMLAGMGLAGLLLARLFARINGTGR